MTIVYLDGTKLWIETIQLTIITAASIGVHVGEQSLTKEGVYLGGTMTGRTGVNENLTAIELQRSGGVTLTVGDIVNRIRGRVGQLDATGRTATYSIMMFMKKAGT